MKTLTRALGLAAIAFGVVTAGWGPIVFEALSGFELPVPVSDDAVAMAIWSGGGDETGAQRTRCLTHDLAADEAEQREGGS